MQLKFFVIANMAGGGLLLPSLSGGDRIILECLKRWATHGYVVKIMTSTSGKYMYKRYLSPSRNIEYELLGTPAFKKYNLAVVLLHTISSLVKGIKAAIRIIGLTKDSVIYSASEFLPDLLPAWIIKLRNRNAKWIAAFYLFAPHPFSKESPYRGLSKMKNVLYFSMQQFSYRIIKNSADMVWVTNELDRWRFIDNKKFTPDNVIAVRGGVDIKTPLTIPEPKEKKFDAVFIGRFHPQKGVLELIDIWRYVCERKKDAKLAMIGVGDLESQVREKIRRYNLENNIVLFGFKDGVEKLKIFKDSKVVVHPAIYDSGGMAACEAMACGLPGVSFDLLALRTYYPKGMLKTPCYDLKAFANNILKLLNDIELYERLRKEALEFAQGWDWDKRAESLLRSIRSLHSTSEYTGS
jgi:glycosyltransferase involved in cell wall biosynthesis